jgi:hypothetical protein
MKIKATVRKDNKKFRGLTVYQGYIKAENWEQFTKINRLNARDAKEDALKLRDFHLSITNK